MNLEKGLVEEHGRVERRTALDTGNEEPGPVSLTLTCPHLLFLFMLYTFNPSILLYLLPITNYSNNRLLSPMIILTSLRNSIDSSSAQI